MYNSHFETVSLSYLASATYLLTAKQRASVLVAREFTLCIKKEPDLFQKSVGCGKKMNAVKLRELTRHD